MRKVIAIDFDGCLCENAWPEIGPPNRTIIRAALKQQRAGAALILWTCRSGELLDKAVAWCREHGLVFDAINENLPERLEHYDSESRKVSADEYWDDLAVRMPLPPGAPLTLEQLREIDGEPVWVSQPDDVLSPFWGVVDAENGFVSNYLYAASFEDYGTEWIAYRRRPEEGDICDE